MRLLVAALALAISGCNWAPSCATEDLCTVGQVCAPSGQCVSADGGRGR